MIHSVTTERRQHRRYLVEGKSTSCTSAGQFTAELVDVGDGGALLLSRSTSVTVGEPIEARFAIAGYPMEVQAKGRVARADTHVIGIAFTEPPPGLDELILWLEAGFLSTIL